MSASAATVAIACVLLAGACVLAACAAAARDDAGPEHARALTFVRGEATFEGSLPPRGEVWLDLGAVVRESSVELEVFVDDHARPRVELRDATRRVHWDGTSLERAPGTALFARIWSRSADDAGAFRVVVRVVPPAAPIDPAAIDVPPPPELPSVPSSTFECKPSIADCNRPPPCSTPGIPVGWPCTGSRTP